MCGLILFFISTNRGCISIVPCPFLIFIDIKKHGILSKNRAGCIIKFYILKATNLFLLETGLSTYFEKGE